VLFSFSFFFCCWFCDDWLVENACSRAAPLGGVMSFWLELLLVACWMSAPLLMAMIFARVELNDISTSFETEVEDG
jgi:hypothetical protein